VCSWLYEKLRCCSARLLCALQLRNLPAGKMCGAGQKHMCTPHRRFTHYLYTIARTFLNSSGQLNDVHLHNTCQLEGQTLNPYVIWDVVGVKAHPDTSYHVILTARCTCWGGALATRSAALCSGWSPLIPACFLLPCSRSRTHIHTAYLGDFLGNFPCTISMYTLVPFLWCAHMHHW
jgi:hypothetical protein